MDTATINGLELEYEDAGSGDAVLLISQVLADGFAPLVHEPALAGDYRLITYHRRGYAGSTHTPPPVTIEDHAADAAAMLDHLGVRRAHIVGHSSSALIALQLALDHPEVVHTLSVLEPTILSLPGAQPLLQKAGPAIEAYASGDHEEALSSFMSAMSGLDWETCRSLVESHIPGAGAQALKDVDTIFGIELPSLMEWTFTTERAASIDQPVLSVRGTATQPLWVEIAELLRSWLPRVEDLLIPGAGHLLHIQRPELVSRGIAEFLGRNALIGG
jgi:pimeloyl-ACP methyl ester carboxylesterase